MTERLLQSCLERTLAEIPRDCKVAVAFSAGPDSSALAVCAQAWAQSNNRELVLFHVHHGLQQQADAWITTAKQLASLLECSLHVRHVTVDLASGHGIEGAARRARYAAIESMAAEHDVQAVLLAHHQQDQAETVLMRLLRGSGITGLAAMAPISQRAGLYWIRPWLDVPRDVILAELASFNEQTGWLPVDDPSNLDGNLARGTLRSKVIPAIESHWPAWQQTLARHAQQAAQADRLLKRYGQQLLGQLAVNGPKQPQVLSLTRWRTLDADQQSLVLRAWLEAAGVQMPTERRLSELVRQLREVHALGHDRALQWSQRDCSVRCVRGQLHLHVKMTGFEGEGGGGAVDP